jgi:hypothetical protein
MPAAGPEKALPGFFTDLISGLSILSTFSADRKISPGYGFTAAPCKNTISALLRRRFDLLILLYCSVFLHPGSRYPKKKMTESFYISNYSGK